MFNVLVKVATIALIAAAGAKAQAPVAPTAIVSDGGSFGGSGASDSF